MLSIAVWNITDEIHFVVRLQIVSVWAAAPLHEPFSQCSLSTSVTNLSEQLDKLFCFVRYWEWQRKSFDSSSCPFPTMSAFFVSIWSDRRVPIFGACCAGCFPLAHPSGLVFKPWPSGSGMMRTLFQSPPSLKVQQSTAWPQQMVSIRA